MADSPETGAGGRPLVRDYTILTLAALAVVFLVLFVEGHGLWGLFPVIIALIALLFRGSGGPALFLIALTVLIVVSGAFSYGPRFRPPPSPLVNVLLAMAALA